MTNKKKLTGNMAKALEAYPTMPTWECAKKFKVNENQLQSLAISRGLRKTYLKRWNDRDDFYIQQLRDKNTAAEIGKLIGRSKSSVLDRIKFLDTGLTQRERRKLNKK